MERVAITGLIALRWAALVWMGIVLVVDYDELVRPWVAFGLIGAALLFTALATTWLQAAPGLLMRPRVLGLELTIAFALVLCDGWAYAPGHAFSSSLSLGSLWPLAAVLSIGLGLGVAWGVAAGVLLGAARLGATLANGVRDFDSSRVLSLMNTAVFYVVAGAIAGYVMQLLRRAEREISASRAREEVARNLHDGVLQTLAIIQRRSSDQDLVRLAREQDRDLRGFLFGDTKPRDKTGDLGTALRTVAARIEDAFGVRTHVLVPFDVPSLADHQVDAIAGAVGEALTNAGKHAGANQLTVFVEPDEDGHVFCSVKDDGDGFDESTMRNGVGISRSIVERMRDVGGRAEIRSHPGSGTEVCLWL